MRAAATHRRTASAMRASAERCRRLCARARTNGLAATRLPPQGALAWPRSGRIACERGCVRLLRLNCCWEALRLCTGALEWLERTFWLWAVWLGCGYLWGEW